MRRRHRSSTVSAVTNPDGLAVGIDIGATAVRAAVVAINARDGRQAASIHGVGEVALTPGTVVNGVVMNQALVTRALRQLWEENAIEGRSVILGITNQQVVVRDLQMPNLGRAQLAKALPFQAREVVPLPMDQVVLDFLPLENLSATTGSAGRAGASAAGSAGSADTISGLLVATPRGPVVAAVSAVERAGLHVARVDLSSFAALRSIADERLPLEAVVDLGAHLTSIVVHAGGVPKVVRSVTRGGQELTDKLAERADLAPDVAEQAKREHGLTGSDRAVTLALREAVRPLVAEVRSSIQYFHTTNPGLRLDRIALTGGCAELPGLAELLTEQVGIHSAVVPALQHIRSRWANREVREAERQRLATAVSVGLAMGAAA